MTEISPQVHSTLDELSDAYGRAEAKYPGAVRTNADRARLVATARATASAAQALNAEAYRKLHASEGDAWMPLDQLTERTEVLTELWDDLASAYEA